MFSFSVSWNINVFLSKMTALFTADAVWDLLHLDNCPISYNNYIHQALLWLPQQSFQLVLSITMSCERKDQVWESED